MVVDTSIPPPITVPVWRGWLHTGALAVSIPVSVWLITAADGAGRTAAAAIYAATLMALLGASAAYHRLPRTPRLRDALRRLDHSMIFLLIAGTYLPVCTIGLPRRWGIPMLIVVGAIAVVGIMLKAVAWGRLTWLQYALYPIMGWVAAGSIPALVRYLSVGQVTLILLGGLAYSAGALVLMRRWPDPWPRVFGYHEVWHGFTLVGAGLHFVAVASLLT